jgi:L-alanine-DL-glutamate epimerase-like enolase superfamily enzyme
VRIARIEAIPFRVPFVAPFATVHGVETHREGLILRVDAGAEGMGECSPLPSFAPGTLDESRAALAGLAPRLVGLEPETALDAVDEAIGGERRLRPLLFALETALLDAIARERGCLLAALLCCSTQDGRTGGRGQAPPLRLVGATGAGDDGERAPWSEGVRGRATVDATVVRSGVADVAASPVAEHYVDAVPVNATVARPDAAEAAEAARRAVAAGFGCVKLKVGVAASAAAEIERIAMVRDAIGPGVALRLDANGAWGVDDAIAILRAAARFDLDLVEQPVAVDDLDGLARVHRECGVPIGADEAVTDLAAAEAILRLEAADVLVVKPMPVGGLRAARRIVELARDAGVGATVTTTLETGVGVAAALHLAATLPPPIRPCGLATLPLLASALLADGVGACRSEVVGAGGELPPRPGGRPHRALSQRERRGRRESEPPSGGRDLRPQGGAMLLPAGSGLGVRVDEGALATYAAGEPMVFGS